MTFWCIQQKTSFHEKLIHYIHLVGRNVLPNIQKNKTITSISAMWAMLIAHSTITVIYFRHFFSNLVWLVFYALEYFRMQFHSDVFNFKQKIKQQFAQTLSSKSLTGSSHRSMLFVSHNEQIEHITPIV